jgi:tetratricopeptide (TPR) repeat protein
VSTAHPSFLVLCLLLLVGGVDGLRAEEAWPDAPPPPLAGPAGELGGEELDDYRYAAALYRALGAELSKGNPALLSTDEAAHLARALLVQGLGAQALELLGERDDLPSELALQLAMGGSTADWSDLERERWLGLFAGQDGESLYWRGRLSVLLQDRDAAKRAFEELLRREPGSVFAPPALEALRELSALSESTSDGEEAQKQKTDDAEADGLRVQWGVYRDARGALRQRDALRAYGQSAEILAFSRDGVELFRVCSPVLGDEEEARRLGENLTRRYGLDFVLLRQLAGGNSP